MQSTPCTFFHDEFVDCPVRKLVRISTTSYDVTSPLSIYYLHIFHRKGVLLTLGWSVVRVPGVITATVIALVSGACGWAREENKCNYAKRKERKYSVQSERRKVTSSFLVTNHPFIHMVFFPFCHTFSFLIFISFHILLILWTIMYKTNIKVTLPRCLSVFRLNIFYFIYYTCACCM